MFLKEERIRLGLSQPVVYENISVSKATYARWEAGSSIPSDKLALLAELGFDVLYVITGVRAVTPSAQASEPLNREEEVLLDNYRNSSTEAKAAIKATSDALAQQHVNKNKLVG